MLKRKMVYVNKVYVNKEISAGMTLLEVMLALAISIVFLAVTARSLVAQRVTAQELKEQMEVNYALTMAQQIISEALASSQTAVWKDGILEIKSWRSEFIDRYYLADKDGDGILDLYREHLGVPNPLVSGVTAWECAPQSEGLWKIHIKAEFGSKRGEVTTYFTPSR